METRICILMNRLNSGRIINMCDGGNFGSRDVQFVDSE